MSIDNSFGPSAGDCRGGLDFTLLFEESILTIVPVVLLVIITPFRLWSLLQRPIKVAGTAILPLKLVGGYPHAKLTVPSKKEAIVSEQNANISSPIFRYHWQYLDVYS